MTEPLARFRAAVIADPASARALAAPIDPQAFAAAARAWAAARGIALDAAALRERAPPLETATLPPPDWLPVAIEDGAVHWLHFAGAPPAGPFFDADRLRAAALPFNRLFAWRTPRAALALTPRRDPDGLVFHLSRCGSTLVAQMLGAPAAHVALSEPAPVDAIVQHAHLPMPDRIAALRGLAARYAGEHRRCFLKLDAWHVRALPLFRAAFPDTPWIFLHRDPVEVIVSHLRRRGRHTVPGLVAPAALGMPEGASGVPVADHIARVIAAIVQGALDHRQTPGGLAIDYAALPEALFTRILPHFGIEPTPEERAAMRAAALSDAKQGGAFQPDVAAKRAQADDAVRAAAAQHLAPLLAHYRG